MKITPDSEYLYQKPRFVEKPYSWVQHIPLAFFLMKKLKPKTFVELGTHSGNSYFAFCQAVEGMNLQTRCFAVDTWEGEVHSDFYGGEVYDRVQRINSENFSMFSSLLKMTFDDAVPKFEAKSIDLLHIDGLHSYTAVRHDFETWLPKLSDVGVVIFHDTDVRERDFGVWQLFEELSGKYPSMNFQHGYGLGLLCIGEKVDEAFIKFVDDANRDARYQDFFAALGERIQLIHESRDMQTELEQYKWLTHEPGDLEKRESSESEKLRIVIRNQNKIISESDYRYVALEKNMHLSVKRKNIQIQRLKAVILEKSDALDAQKQELVALKQTRVRQLLELLKNLNPTVVKSKLLIRKQTKLIENCELFDKEYYVKNNPDIGESGMNPVVHYLLYGGFEGRNPGLEFDNAYYLSRYDDVSQSGLNPLLHYVLYGKNEGRKTIVKDIQNHAKIIDDLSLIAESGLYDEEYYLANNPDLVGQVDDPLLHFYLHGGKEGRNPGSEFDTNFYLSNYPIAGKSNLNPVIHYLRLGRGQSWCINSKKTKIGIKFKSKEIGELKKAILVIVPVFVRHVESFELFSDLITSLQNAYPQPGKYLSFLFIDDASPMPEIEAFYRKTGFFSRKDVKIIKNKSNLGFSASVNKVLKRRGVNSDLVILNSDTRVFTNTFETLQDVAMRDGRIATVTPFSNAATIASIGNWPEGVEQICGFEQSHVADKIRGLNLKTEIIPVPTGNGFCMYMTDEAIMKVGDFNQQIFGKGYGEENDWCQRAIQQDFINILCPEVYVYHFETGSFSSMEQMALKSENGKKLDVLHPLFEDSVRSLIETDPLELHRILIEIKLTEIHKEKNELSSLAFFLHRDPYKYIGGTELHVNELSHGLLKHTDEYEIFMFYPSIANGDKFINIRYLNNNGDCDFVKEIPAQHFEPFLEYFSERLDFIHVHHFLGWDHRVLDWLTSVKGLLKIATLHDYIPFCVDSSFKQKGLKLMTGFGHPDISKYELSHYGIEEYKNVLSLYSTADMLLLPSGNCRNIIREFISFYNVKTTVLPHFLSYFGPESQLKGKCDITKDKIVFLGSASRHKGVHLFLEAAKHLTAKGYVCEIWGGSNINITDIPMYPYRGVQDLIQRRVRPYIVVMPSELPETFSFTLFEALFILNTPVVVGPFGNPAEFVQQHRVGQVMNSFTTHALLDAVSVIEKNYGNFQSNLIETMKDVGEDYKMNLYLEKYKGILHGSKTNKED